MGFVDDAISTAGKIAEAFVPLEPMGLTGLKRQGGYVYDEFHPKLQGKKLLESMREMKDNNAVCGSVWWSHEALVRQADLNLTAAGDQPEEQFYRDRIEDMMDDMSMTRQEFLSDVMSMVWAGHSVHEIVWKICRGESSNPKFRSKYSDGVVALRKLPIRSQDSLIEWDFQDDGGLNGVIQEAWPTFERNHLKMDRLLLFRIFSNKGNPEGRPLFRNAHRSWWFLKRIQELEAIGVERDMAGLMVFEMPPRFFEKDATGKLARARAVWRKVMERARRGQYDGLLIPSEVYDGKPTGYKARLMQSGGRRPMDVDIIIKRLESRIALSVLGQSVLLGMQGTAGSSRSLASSKTLMSSMALKAEMDSITDVLNRFLIPRIAEVNRWPKEAMPSYEFGDIETDDMESLLGVIPALLESGALEGGPVFNKWMKKRIGIPEEKAVEFGSNEMLDAAAQLAEDGDPGADVMAEVANEDVVPIAAQQETASRAMTAQEAADRLQVSPAVIMRAIRNGQIPGAKIGGTFRMLPEDLMAYMRGQQAAA